MSTSTKATVGRPRLFDEETVLAELTSLFWRQGYTRTSMSDAVAATGVHKPSLYRTFGCKEELFATVLRHYCAERIALFADLVERAGHGTDGIHRFLEMVEADAVTERGRDGCLVVTASNELRGTLAGYDFAADYRRRLREQLGVLVARSLPTDEADPQRAAARTDLLTTYLLGLQVLTRSGADAGEVHRHLQAMHLTVDTW